MLPKWEAFFVQSGVCQSWSLLTCPKNLEIKGDHLLVGVPLDNLMALVDCETARSTRPIYFHQHGHPRTLFFFWGGEGNSKNTSQENALHIDTKLSEAASDPDWAALMARDPFLRAR